MKTDEDAAALAQEMVAIGAACGRKMTAVLTDMEIPLGQNIGNALEVAEAMEVLRGAGLDVPQTTLLLQELADLGYDLPRDALTPEEGAEALAKILSERSRAL
jgi:thymidine phosphorylase